MDEKRKRCQLGRVESRAANDPLVFTITENAPTRAFSWLKVPTSTFTIKKDTIKTLGETGVNPQ